MNTIKKIKTNVYMEALSLFGMQSPAFANENFATFVYNGLKRMQDAKCFTESEIKEVKDYANKVSADFMKKAVQEDEKNKRKNFKF